MGIVGGRLPLAGSTVRAKVWPLATAYFIQSVPLRLPFESSRKVLAGMGFFSGPICQSWYSLPGGRAGRPEISTLTPLSFQRIRPWEADAASVPVPGTDPPSYSLGLNRLRIMKANSRTAAAAQKTRV